MFWYAFSSLTPAVFLALACLWGGIWPAVSVVLVTALVFFMDRIVVKQTPKGGTSGGAALMWVLGGVHCLLWALGIWAIAANPVLDGGDRIVLCAGLGLYFGQVSNSNAHELIHRAARAPRRLGIVIYGSLLFAHHASAHLRVHHVWAGTAQDPSTARLGEGFWRYLPRAWFGAVMAGKRAEDRLRRARGTLFWSHPYTGYTALSLAAIAFAALIAGWRGVFVLLVIAAYAQIQLYLSDYVQHYGLLRRIHSDGKPVPIGPERSWNAPQWYSSAMMLNASLHSDHHGNPARAFPDLSVARGRMPMLPHSLPVMATIALVPWLWRWMMDKRALRWRDPAGGAV